MEGAAKSGVSTMETRLKRGMPVWFVGGVAEKCCKEAVEDVRRLLVSECTKGRMVSGFMASDCSWKKLLQL